MTLQKYAQENGLLLMLILTDYNNRFVNNQSSGYGRMIDGADKRHNGHFAE